MAKKKKERTGSVVNQMEVARAAGEMFLRLCKQYEALGKTFVFISKVAAHTQFNHTVLPVEVVKMVAQHHEMGEQLKELGACIDLMPGSGKVFKGEAEPVENTFAQAQKRVITEEEFIQNTKPEEANNDK